MLPGVLLFLVLEIFTSHQSVVPFWYNEGTKACYLLTTTGRWVFSDPSKKNWGDFLRNTIWCGKNTKRVELVWRLVWWNLFVKVFVYGFVNVFVKVFLCKTQYQVLHKLSVFHPSFPPQPWPCISLATTRFFFLILGRTSRRFWHIYQYQSVSLLQCSPLFLLITIWFKFSYSLRPCSFGNGPSPLHHWSSSIPPWCIVVDTSCKLSGPAGPGTFERGRPCFSVPIASTFYCLLCDAVWLYVRL